MKIALLLSLCAGSSAFTAPRCNARSTALAASRTMEPMTQAPMQRAPPPRMEQPYAPEQPYYAEPAPPMRPPVLSDQEVIWGAKGGTEWKYGHRSSFDSHPDKQTRDGYNQAYDGSYAQVGRDGTPLYHDGSRGTGADTWYHASYSKYNQDGSGEYETRHRPSYTF